MGWWWCAACFLPVKRKHTKSDRAGRHRLPMHQLFFKPSKLPSTILLQPRATTSETRSKWPPKRVSARSGGRGLARDRTPCTVDRAPYHDARWSGDCVCTLLPVLPTSCYNWFRKTGLRKTAATTTSQDQPTTLNPATKQGAPGFCQVSAMTRCNTWRTRGPSRGR